MGTKHDAAPIRDWVFDGDRLRESHIRLTPAFAREVDEAEVTLFAERVRLPGSGAVARLFGRLEAWKAARVERQAQVAVGDVRSPVRYTFKASGLESVERAFQNIEAASRRGAR